MEKATFGAGCFWCVEAIFQNLEGVNQVISGYTGGHVDNPTYQQICTGTTGHAEVTQITYDPEIISFKELLEIFWKTHDPTTINRQGNDVGTQYRSAVFYQNQDQKEEAEKMMGLLEGSHIWPNPIITELSPIGIFYPAEDYHQNYFNEHGEQPYCQIVIKPKVEKLEKLFGNKIKN
jgi:peptide-methionine (S)-S-oxide reductase